MDLEKLILETTSIEDLLSKLRDQKKYPLFTMIPGELISDEVTWNNDRHESLQYLVIQTSFAKNPQNDSFDFTTMIGIDYLRRQLPYVVWYENRKWKKTFTLSWSDNGVNFKVKKIPVRYPDELGIEERRRYRGIDEKIKRGGKYTDEEIKFRDYWRPKIYERNKGRGIEDLI